MKKISKRKKRQHRLEYIAVVILIRIIWLLPLPALLTLGNWMGRLAFDWLKIRRNTVMKNLKAAFPEKDEAELLAIAKRTYQNFAKMALEFMTFPRLKPAEVLSRCEIVNQAGLEEVRNAGKGGVMVAGHFGNWELMGAVLALSGFPVHAIVANQRNGAVDDIMNRHREALGVGVVHVGAAIRGIIRALNRKEFVAILADQNARSQGVFVDFFGRPASTPQGPAAFALKTGAPMVFGSAVRLPGGKHRMIVELIPHDHLKGGPTEENVRELTQIYTRKLEEMIRKYPDHWFWMHRRWKSKPPLQKG